MMCPIFLNNIIKRVVFWIVWGYDTRHDYPQKSVCSCKGDFICDDCHVLNVIDDIECGRSGDNWRSMHVKTK